MRFRNSPFCVGGNAWADFFIVVSQSAVDAMIGTLLCDGVVNPYHSGIGGATFFNIYDKQKNIEDRYARHIYYVTQNAS